MLCIVHCMHCINELTRAHRGAGSKPFDEARVLISSSRKDNPVPNGRVGRVNYHQHKIWRNLNEISLSATVQPLLICLR